MKRQDLPVDDGRHRFHLGENLEARLGLRRFRRLGAESIDERLQMFALVVLFLLLLELDRLLFAPLAFKT